MADKPQHEINSSGTDLTKKDVEYIREALGECAGARSFRDSYTWRIHNVERLPTIPVRFRPGAEGILEVTAAKDSLRITLKLGTDQFVRCLLRVPPAIANKGAAKEDLARELTRKGKLLRERRQQDADLEEADRKARERGEAERLRRQATGAAGSLDKPPEPAAGQGEKDTMPPPLPTGRKRICGLSLLRTSRTCQDLLLAGLKNERRQNPAPVVAGRACQLVRQLFEFSGKTVKAKGQPTDRGIGVVLLALAVKDGILEYEGKKGDPEGRTYWPAGEPRILPQRQDGETGPASVEEVAATSDRQLPPASTSELERRVLALETEVRDLRNIRRGLRLIAQGLSLILETSSEGDT